MEGVDDNSAVWPGLWGSLVSPGGPGAVAVTRDPHTELTVFTGTSFSGVNSAHVPAWLLFLSAHQSHSDLGGQARLGPHPCPLRG